MPHFPASVALHCMRLQIENSSQLICWLISKVIFKPSRVLVVSICCISSSHVTANWKSLCNKQFEDLFHCFVKFKSLKINWENNLQIVKIKILKKKKSHDLDSYSAASCPCVDVEVVLKSKLTLCCTSHTFISPACVRDARLLALD